MLNDSIITIRALLFAPIAEELAFRSLIVGSLATALYENGGITSVADSTLWLAGVAPLFFGAAHLHHLIENLRRGQRLPSALISTLIQFSYTYIFGAIATLLFLRTGSIYSAIVSHIICNFVGLPNLAFLEKPKYATDETYRSLYPWRMWLVAIHGLGLVLFALLLFPLTAGSGRFLLSRR